MPPDRVSEEDTTTWAAMSDAGEEDPGAAVEDLGAALAPPANGDGAEPPGSPKA